MKLQSGWHPISYRYVVTLSEGNRAVALTFNFIPKPREFRYILEELLLCFEESKENE